MKKTISILLAVSIGFLFILSAATKVYPMELFEYQFVDIGIANWHTTLLPSYYFYGIFLRNVVIFKYCSPKIHAEICYWIIEFLLHLFKL